jgi:hypothetical protein
MSIRFDSKADVELQEIPDNNRQETSKISESDVRLRGLVEDQLLKPDNYDDVGFT